MDTDKEGNKLCRVFKYATAFNYLTHRSTLVDQLLDQLKIVSRQATYYADMTRDTDYETKELKDCGMVRVSYYDKRFSQVYGPRNKVTEIGIYQVLAFLSDVGGILKITGLLFALLTSYCYRKRIKTKLRKVHSNMNYILSYEGLAGLFDDVQRLKRIVSFHLIETTKANSDNI